MRTIHTPRLTLRPIAESDTEAIVELYADPELSRFHAHDLTRRNEVEALVGRRLAYRGPRGTGDWVFVLDGSVVGMGHLRTSTELPGGVVECGFSLARRHWGAGLGSEATAAILQHAFGTVGAPAVFALIHEHDGRSLTMAARLGFVMVGSGEHYGATHRVLVALPKPAGLHHVEIWVPDLAATEASWGWLLTELGWTEYQRWQHGVSWRLGQTYLVFEDSPARSGAEHDRLRPGLNHLALHAGPPQRVEELVKAGPEHGWRLLFADRHPHAGGPEHYAAYLENGDGYEVELVGEEAVA